MVTALTDSANSPFITAVPCGRRAIFLAVQTILLTRLFQSLSLSEAFLTLQVASVCVCFFAKPLVFTSHLLAHLPGITSYRNLQEPPLPLGASLGLYPQRQTEPSTPELENTGGGYFT